MGRGLSQLLLSASIALGSFACGKANREPLDLFVGLTWEAAGNQSECEAGEFCGCMRAGVEEITWVLVDADGDEVEGETAGCEPEISIKNLKPGTYSLFMIGLDEDGIERWNNECFDLSLRRFDAFYLCEIPAIDAAEQSDSDAGV